MCLRKVTLGHFRDRLLASCDSVQAAQFSFGWVGLLVAIVQIVSPDFLSFV